MRKIAIALAAIFALSSPALAQSDSDCHKSRPKKRHNSKKEQYERELATASHFLRLEKEINILATLSDYGILCHRENEVNNLGINFVKAQTERERLRCLIENYSPCEGNTIDFGGIFKIEIFDPQDSTDKEIELGLRELRQKNWSIQRDLSDLAYAAVPLNDAWHRWSEELKCCGKIAELCISDCNAERFKNAMNAASVRPLAALYETTAFGNQGGCEIEEITKKFIVTMYQYYSLLEQSDHNSRPYHRLTELEQILACTEKDALDMLLRLPPSARWEVWRDDSCR